MDDQHDMPRDELSSRVLFTLLQSSARLGLNLGASRKGLSDWLDMALFRAARLRGNKLAETAELLQVSVRKASRLSKQLKQNFLDADASVGLPRRIEFMLWGEPLGEKRLAQALGVPGPELRVALDELLAAGRIEAHAGRTTTYAVSHKDSRLVRDGWMSRLDGLADLVDTVTEAVAARFFGQDPRSFARTISFRVRPEDIPKLHALYEEHIWPTISRLDGLAHEEAEDATETLAMSIVWAPDGYVPPDAP